jgi:hypothetical protein
MAARIRILRSLSRFTEYFEHPAKATGIVQAKLATCEGRPHQELWLGRESQNPELWLQR